MMDTRREGGLLHLVIGEPSDDCPLCRAAARGAGPEEIAALAVEPGLALPPGAAVVVIGTTEGGGA
jgi:hypothetical protein